MGSGHEKNILHASCVAWNGRGLLILGPSGSGKSALALRLMAYGAALVSDDRTVVELRDESLVASAPGSIAGMIEARSVGLLAASAIEWAALKLAVDLGQIETERLPPERDIRLLGAPLPCLHKVESAHFPAAVLQYLKAGRRA